MDCSATYKNKMKSELDEVISNIVSSNYAPEIVYRAEKLAQSILESTAVLIRNNGNAISGADIKKALSIHGLQSAVSDHRYTQEARQAAREYIDILPGYNRMFNEEDDATAKQRLQSLETHGIILSKFQPAIKNVIDVSKERGFAENKPAMM